MRGLVCTPVAFKQAVSRTAVAPSGLFSKLFDLPTKVGSLKQKEFVVQPLPKITLAASDYPRLEKLARVAAQQGDATGIFLAGEIERAKIIPDEASEVASLVTPGSWVTYWINWGVPPRTVQLVWPDECSPDPSRISVLSPLGAALLGLREGDRMPYPVAGCLNLVTVQSVSQSGPNVVPLFPRFTTAGPSSPGDDPGPTAA
ncbi:GreA/GreB family elongation factor [Bradyrhizobium ganzhouense]|uniref:GreA/GreB family elongation factor n=1 Tax=Bradyrhizobium ganzhouense TaxID=1179767 RepID=UPI003CE6C28A